MEKGESRKKQLKQEVTDFDRMMKAILLVIRPAEGCA
jgi:hypothetical protein